MVPRRVVVVLSFVVSFSLADPVSAAGASASALNAAIPGCHGILTDALVDRLRAESVDPHETFEAMRQKKRLMLQESPLVECLHDAWSLLHRTGGPPPLLDPGAFAARENGNAFARAVAPLLASVSANIPLASGVQGYQGEATIAVDPSNPLRMAAGANTQYADPAAACQSPAFGITAGTQALYGSTDGGLTWTYSCAPWDPNVDGSVPPDGFVFFGSDPALAFDAAGNVYAAYMLASQGLFSGAIGVSIVVAKSTDAGVSWASHGVVVNRIDQDTDIDDKELMAIDTTSGGAHSHTNRLYVIWDEGNVERVAYSDGGTSFTTVVVGTGAPNNDNIGGHLAVGPDGTVYAVWNRIPGSGGDTTVFRKSTDGGATWSLEQTIFVHTLNSFDAMSANAIPAQNGRKINAFAAIDVDRNPASANFGRLYVVTSDFPSGPHTATDVNVYLIRSTDGGATWSPRVLVNDDATTTASQFFPWLAVDQSDGSLHVAFYDTRGFTGGGGDKKTQIYAARSVNGGVSFETNLLVDDGGANFVNHLNYSDENTADNTNANANQYGDYVGIVAANRQVRPVWADSRQYFGGTNDAKAEDLGTARITYCSAPVFAVTPAASCAGGSVGISWTAPSSWGTNATSGTYDVYRYTNAGCTAGESPVAAGLSGTSTTGPVPPAGTTYFYRVVARNDCPGTALTPMSTPSSCSAGVTDGSVPVVTAPAGSTVTQTLCQ